MARKTSAFNSIKVNGIIENAAVVRTLADVSLKKRFVSNEDAEKTTIVHPIDKIITLLRIDK